MYRVIAYNGVDDAEGAVLHEPESYGNKAITGTIELLFNGVDTAEFKIPMNNSLYRKMEPITWLVKVVNTVDGEIVFDGRVAKIDGEFSGLHSQTIKCEDCLAYLHDSTQIYRKVQNTTIKQFLQMLVDEHNKQVEPWKRFRLDRVTVENSTDNVYRYTEDTKDTFDTIKDKLIDRLGGYLIWHRDSSGGLVLDYLKEYGEMVDTPIMLGKNLQSAKREFDVTELITRLVPVGSAIEQPEGAPVDQGQDAAMPKYTIDGVNNGVRYLEDAALKDRFGTIQKAVEWQDVKVPQILKSKGLQYLSNQRVGLLSWTVDVVDISLLDPSYKSFQLGNYYPIVDDFLSVTENLQVVEKKLDITQPQKMTLKIGTQNKTLSQYQLEYQAAMTTIEEQRQNAMQTVDAMQKQLKTLQSITNKIPAQEAQIEDLIKRINELEAGDGNGSGGDYTGGDMTNAGYTISQANLNLIRKNAKAMNLRPSFLVAQMFIESHWGDPNTSYVGNVDHNWNGISEPFSVPADLGVQMSQGTARPANEGGYYVHFETLADYFKAYAFLLSKRNGIYNVAGATSIDAFCKGLFRVGGATYDYAAAGYESYRTMLRPTYSAIINQNGAKISQLDK